MNPSFLLLVRATYFFTKNPTSSSLKSRVDTLRSQIDLGKNEQEEMEIGDRVVTFCSSLYTSDLEEELALRVVLYDAVGWGAVRIESETRDATVSMDSSGGDHSYLIEEA